MKFGRAEGPPITDALARWGAGESEALDLVVEFLHVELRSACASALAREREPRPLQPTELVAEVYVRLREIGRSQWPHRGAFLGFVARVARNVLVEQARAHRALKREGQRQRVELDSSMLALSPESHSIDALDLERALEALSEVDPDLVQLVELRFFAGLSERETAEAMGIARATVQRHWRFAKHFLARELERPGE